MDLDGNIRYQQSVPEDRSRYIRLSEDNDALGQWSMERARPEVTKVLVAGQGQYEERTLKLVEGNPNDWGTNRIVFQDRRDTDELEDLVEAGEERWLTTPKPRPFRLIWLIRRICFSVWTSISATSLQSN